MSIEQGIKYLEDFFKHAKTLLPKEDNSRAAFRTYLMGYKGKRIDGRFNLMPGAELRNGVQYYISESKNHVVVSVFQEGEKINVHLTVPKLKGHGELQEDSLHFTNEENGFHVYFDYDTGEIKGEVKGNIPEPAAAAAPSVGPGARSAAAPGVRGMPQRGRPRGGTRRSGPSIYPAKSSRSFVPRMKTLRAR
jgi:hypothetical protein